MEIYARAEWHPWRYMYDATDSYSLIASWHLFAYSSALIAMASCSLRVAATACLGRVRSLQPAVASGPSCGTKSCRYARELMNLRLHHLNPKVGSCWSLEGSSILHPQVSLQFANFSLSLGTIVSDGIRLRPDLLPRCHRLLDGAIIGSPCVFFLSHVLFANVFDSGRSWQ